MESKTLELQIKILAQQAHAQVSALSGELKSLAAQTKALAPDAKGLADTFKRYESEAAMAANSFKLFGASSAEVKRQQEMVKQAALDLVEAGIKPESQEVQNLVAQYKQLETQAKAIDKAAGDNVRSFGDLKSAVTQTAAAVALIKVTGKVKDLGGFALAQADAFSNARNEFGTLLGDMEAGAALFDRIKAFNDKTPFDLSTTKQAVNVLLSADVPLANINARLTQFGDLSQGNAQKFSSYTNAFSMAAARGKADMHVLNTFIHQGVPILDELAKGFGTNKEAVMDMVSQGKVSFADFTTALDRLTAEGGRYFGGMELGSRSLAAMQAGLKESVNALAASYGNMLLPAATKVLGLFANFVNVINENALVKGILAGTVVALTGYLAAMAVKQALAAVKTWALYAAQMGLNSAMAITNPLLLAGIAAATAATIAVVAYTSAQQKAAEKTAGTALAAREQADAYQTAAAAARQYAEALTDMGVSAQRGVLRDAESHVAAAYQEIARVQRLLAATPQTTTETRRARRYASETYETDNPRYAEYQEALEAANAQLMQAKANVYAITERMEELRESSLAAFGMEWQDKLLTGIEAVSREEDKAIGELKAKAFSAFKEDFETNRAYQTELAALREFYRRKRADAERKDAENIGAVWRDKMLSGAAAVERERQRSMEELQTRAEKIHGKDYEQQAEYTAEIAALNAHYDDKRHNAALEERQREREAIMRAHSLRMENYRTEWEYQRELARRDGDYAQFAEAEAMAQTANTQAGQLFAGADPVTMFITALVKAVLALENVNKTLNFMDTIVEGIMSVIGPIIDGSFADIVNILTSIGEIAGKNLASFIDIVAIRIKLLAGLLQIIMAPLTALGSAFEWLHNQVIYPAGNALIRGINGIIDLLNTIPGVNVQKIQYLEAIGDLAKEIAEEMERRKEEITKMYERQKDRVRDELAAQISSIRQQYELGLLSRTEYEKQAEQYQGNADAKLIDINADMLKELEKITENTYRVLSPQQQAEVQKSYAQKWGETVPVVGHIAGAVVDAGKAIWNGIKKLFHFDAGTPFIPFDMPAMVHQGEGIIPKSFNAGIQAGDYALIGRNWPGRGSRETGGNGGVAVNVSVIVEGSVIRERGLVEAVYEGIAAGIKSGGLDPLPA